MKVMVIVKATELRADHEVDGGPLADSLGGTLARGGSHAGRLFNRGITP